MPPARPAPLKTSGHPIIRAGPHSAVPFSPLPSEIPRTPLPGGNFEALKTPLSNDALKTPITPPTAYTDFLKATINSPAIASPRSSFSGSLPYSPATTGSMSYRTGGLMTPATPYPPASAGQPAMKKQRCPPSPSAESRATKTRSPDSMSSRSEDEPASPKSKRECGGSGACDVAVKKEADTEMTVPTIKTPTTRSRTARVTVKQIVKTTVTYTPPQMNLMPAPKGKRRRVD